MHSTKSLLTAVVVTWACTSAAHADIRYSVSVYTLPTSTWWGSFAVVTPTYVTSPVSFAPSQLSVCTVVSPSGQQCLGVSFDPQGADPDRVTFTTTAGSIDLLFADGTFSGPAALNSIGNTGSLFAENLNPIPEPGSLALWSAGLVGLFAKWRQGRRETASG